MPIFTSLENARLYKQRDSLDCLLVELATSNDLNGYISKPPSRSSKSLPFKIVVDPIDPATEEFMLFDPQNFLDAT
jgi:hypothetical protein